MPDEQRIVDARDSSNQLVVVVLQFRWPDPLKPFNFWVQIWVAVLFGVKWFEGHTPSGTSYWSFEVYLGPFVFSLSRDF